MGHGDERGYASLRSPGTDEGVRPYFPVLAPATREPFPPTYPGLANRYLRCETLERDKASIMPTESGSCEKFAIWWQ